MLKLIVRPDGTGTLIEYEEGEVDGNTNPESEDARQLRRLSMRL